MTTVSWKRIVKLETDGWLKIPPEILEALEIPGGVNLFIGVKKKSIVIEPVPGEGFE